MRHTSWSRLTLAMAAATLPGAALGQDAQTAQAGTQPQVAEQCLADLTAFSQRLDQEQWWITGWGGVGGLGGAGRVPPEGPAVRPGNEPIAPATGVGVSAGSPWGVTLGAMQSPRNEIRVLYLAARVLANQGKQDGCEYVLAELRNTYEGYARQLTEAGIDPARITDWRQEQIALAEPVEKLQATAGLTVDDLTGTDVRTRGDESLGSVADVVFDSRTGDLRYVIVARGGFLGIGEDHVPVPWEQFLMAPGLNTLVLDVPVAAMETAPSLEENAVFDPEANPEGARAVEEFWSGQTGSRSG